MKQLRFMAALLCLFLVNIIPVSANEEVGSPKVIDEAELLSEAEETELTEQINGIVEQYQIDVILVTEHQIQEADFEAEAKRLYNDNGYGIGDGKNAILFIVEMNSGECSIYQLGNENVFLVNEDLSPLFNNVVHNYLSAGQYTAGFKIYLDGIAKLYENKQLLDSATGGASQAQEKAEKPPKSKSPIIYLIPALICGAIITLIWRTFSNRGRYTEDNQGNANAYRNTDASFNVHKSAVFLTSNITKKIVKKEQDLSVEQKERK